MRFFPPRTEVDPMTTDPDEELADRVRELEDTLEALHAELEDRDRRLMARRPPSVRDVLRFADEFAIPAAIAILDANRRMLELVQGAIRATERGRAAGEGSASIGREAVDRLDRALNELQTALQESSLPENAEARQLLQEARTLRDEIDERMAESGDNREESTAVEIDIDGEIESIRDELDEEDDDSE